MPTDWKVQFSQQYASADREPNSRYTSAKHTYTPETGSRQNQGPSPDLTDPPAG